MQVIVNVKWNLKYVFEFKGFLKVHFKLMILKNDFSGASQPSIQLDERPET